MIKLKNLLIESINEAKFSKDQIEIMKMAYGTLSGMNPSSPTYKKFIKFLDKLPKDQLKQLAGANIKFVSMLAKNRLRGESVNEDLTPLRKIYADLDKKFPKYNHKKISDVNKVVKFLKRKLKPGSQLPDFVASFYNDYRGGEDITKNHKRFFQYTGKMLKKKESVKEAGMGILTTDQSDVLQGIVLRNKNKSLKSILNVALKSGYFKNVDKKELLGYIDGARQFVKYMKSHPMESINEKMGPEQYHKYMQYVFDTQFKTPEEKKMKKSIIKKINKAQKKKGLPVFKEERDYKAEYKKYGSSTKAKKYRAELNQYNRKKGTYGNGDGKDASHKGGKIAGFEKESTNRGRAEKSRLKK